ncbi:hydroxymethylglutaryl-CoA reductase, degradative [Erysipelothrix larvae]
MSQYKGFYKKSIAERLEILKRDRHINPDYFGSLPASTYNNMIENAITTFELPMGVSPNYCINGRQIVIPMVTEEPSVIAASSNAANIIKQNGGFTSSVISRVMRGEIAFVNPNNPQAIQDFIETHQEALFDNAHQAHPSIIKRGGGVQSITTRHITKDDNTLVIVDVLVDTQEAMGANMINTILESLRTLIETNTQEHALMAILTNNTPECLVHAHCTLDPSTLKFSDTIGQKITEASLLSKLDPFRTATHNKGIMNGVDAILIATGNDWRAVNAGIYSYHSRNGQLEPFTTWSLNDEGMICGETTLPLALGSVGGSIGLNPKVKLAYEILGFHDVKSLMECIACVALAQNFAAIYALTTDGIQKGHMALHARNLALKAGAKPTEVEALVHLLLKQPHLNSDTAKACLEQLKATHSS